MAKKDNNISFFLPLLLFLILCILIVSFKILEQFQKNKKFEKKEIEKLYPPEIKPIIPDRIKKPVKKVGEVAIIIDDVGWNLSIVKEIEKINQH